jgi:hypothetical protein
LRNTWNRASENLFSAWIEKMFDDPLDAEPSWRALHEVVRDPSRNFLFNHLGLNEDAKIYLRPDCAIFPTPCARTSRTRWGRGAHPTGRERIFRVFERTGAARAAGSEADRARALIR